MRVEQSEQAEVVKAQSGVRGAATNAPKTAFASVLAESSTTNGTGGSNTSPQTAEGTGKVERAIPKGPKGETTRVVKDHPAYVEVMSGPRNGMFINMTSNERRGEAFVIVHKDDRDLHVYGTGKNRRVIVSWHKDQPAHQADKPDAGKKTEPEAKPATGGASAPSA
jgi:hypothetical protein